MKREAGVVLINALVIVLAISSVAAALLLRSESARLRAESAQGAEQLSLYLDGVEQLIPGLLDDVKDAITVHPGQPWAQAGRTYPIDRGRVSVDLVDLQGRLNVNWLMSGDPFVEEVFSRVFSAARLPQSLLLELVDFVQGGGPRATAEYLARTPSLLPRGGPLRAVDDLRELRGMTAAHFAVLAPLISALPASTRLNLNTAPKSVLTAVLEPLPAELRGELLSAQGPITSIAAIREQAMVLLETEDIEHLQLQRFATASRWFRAELRASLDGAVQRRQVVYLVEPDEVMVFRPVLRWAVYD